jgi:hypothetical protein
LPLVELELVDAENVPVDADVPAAGVEEEDEEAEEEYDVSPHSSHMQTMRSSEHDANT